MSAVLACAFSAVPGVEHCLGVPSQQAEAPPDFAQLLQRIASFNPDPCGRPHGEDQDSADLEASIFRQAADIVTLQLNAPPAGPRSPLERAQEALTRLSQISAAANASWLGEHRYHFEILDLPPVLVVKMGLRTHETFFVFGIPEKDSGTPSLRWHSFGSTDEHDVLQSGLDLYPLHRGPSRHARFLARFNYSSCAGSTGVAYHGREWIPAGGGGLEQIIDQAGAFGLDDNVPGFEQIGKLGTVGSTITLPYCWYSRIDTWANPSLCAVDSYDVTGDHVMFRTRTYNRPDLVPIAKVIEYAEQRDYPAVLAYCAFSHVARKLVRDMPPYVFADDLRVTRTGIGKEHAELGYPTTYRFDVEKRAGRWQVVAFSSE